MDKSVNGLLGTSIDKIREMVDVSTVIGEPLSIPGGITIIPVSKVTYGFASGGSDLPSQQPKELFGGGGGAGISITPVAFLVINGTDVSMLPVVSKPDTADRIVSLVPEMVDKVSAMIKKDEPKTAGDCADKEEEKPAASAE